MAKGDKKKKAKPSTPEASLTKLANCSATSVVSEPPLAEATPEDDDLIETANCSAASFTSQPPLTENPEPSVVEFYEVPVLSNIIVKSYEGETHRDMFHGEGVAYFQGGHVYKGTFSEGFMHGHGIYSWADGVKYEGDFVLNVPLGHGVYTWLDGSSYEGQVCNGIRHGVGTYRCGKTSVSYRGEWHHGKRHGKGTIYYNQELTSWYEGDWVDNIREGWGVRCYPSGNIYEGQWKKNARHGEGKMKWLDLGQQYSGQWEHGLQHGQGTHTWFLKRVAGSQYPLRNEYVGDFVQGLRHGQGKFYYASGALYEGEWKDNKKHGQGKFTFKNGRIFEGEFVDDHMAEFPAFSMDGTRTPDLSGIRTHTPPCGKVAASLGSSSSLLGPDMALEIESLLESLPGVNKDMELRQVEFAVLRHIAELRTIYSFYSSLGHEQSPDNTFLLTRMKFWRLLRDCNVHRHRLTLAQMDRLIGEDVPPEEVHSPFGTMLLRKFVSYVIVLAYHIYHKEIESTNNVLVACFTKLMRENIIPNARNVKGFFFSNPDHTVIAVNYTDKCWEIYQTLCVQSSSTPNDQIMDMRHFIWMLKDLGLYDNELTTGKVLEILSAENPAVYSGSHSNLNLEMTFLEFFEALLGCAEVKGSHLAATLSESTPVMNRLAESVEASPGQDLGDSPILLTQQPSLLMGKSKEMLQTSTSDEKGLTLNAKSAVADVTAGCAPQLVDSPSAEMEGHDGGTQGDTMVRSVPAVDGPAPSPLHSPSTDPAEGPESELDLWIRATHLFFSRAFFPAYEHSLLLRKEVQEERLRRAAQDRIALAKARRAARLRELAEAEEEERRREEEEEEEAERADGLDENPHPQSPALLTPVASATCVNPKQSSASGPKKRR
ncbi:radial spoke head 10 homolog B [Megalops cyprinoides]|uniref:radial spoke head 10 homolog B n=1 Tax=Megalops cyprinoides TaxID=118141 RepID=UPI00186505AE|nr:radial spoke head 10 homolog B [Megalops cyprinoides]